RVGGCVAMDADVAHAERRHLSRGRFKSLRLRFVRRREEVAATIHPKYVGAVARGLLEQIDAVRHESEHRVVGTWPPVAIALRALVAREREWIALVGEDDPRDSVLDGQVICGGDAGDAGSADDDVGGR